MHVAFYVHVVGCLKRTQHAQIVDVPLQALGRVRCVVRDAPYGVVRRHRMDGIVTYSIGQRHLVSSVDSNRRELSESALHNRVVRLQRGAISACYECRGHETRCITTLIIIYLFNIDDVFGHSNAIQGEKEHPTRAGRAYIVLFRATRLIQYRR